MTYQTKIVSDLTLGIIKTRQVGIKPENDLRFVKQTKLITVVLFGATIETINEMTDGMFLKDSKTLKNCY